MTGITKPTFPEWATSGSAQIAEPSLGIKQLGLQAGNAFYARFYNWLQKQHYSWFLYLDSLIERSGDHTLLKALGNTFIQLYASGGLSVNFLQDLGLTKSGAQNIVKTNGNLGIQNGNIELSNAGAWQTVFKKDAGELRVGTDSSSGNLCLYSGGVLIAEIGNSDVYWHKYNTLPALIRPAANTHWYNGEPGTEYCTYFRNIDNEVSVQGFILANASYEASPFSAPIFYHPAVNQSFLGYYLTSGDPTFFEIIVNTSGEVTVHPPSGVDLEGHDIWLNNIHFLHDGT